MAASIVDSVAGSHGARHGRARTAQKGQIDSEIFEYKFRFGMPHTLCLDNLITYLSGCGGVGIFLRGSPIRPKEQASSV